MKFEVRYSTETAEILSRIGLDTLAAVLFGLSGLPDLNAAGVRSEIFFRIISASNLRLISRVWSDVDYSVIERISPFVPSNDEAKFL